MPQLQRKEEKEATLSLFLSLSLSLSFWLTNTKAPTKGREGSLLPPPFLLTWPAPEKESLRDGIPPPPQ